MNITGGAPGCKWTVAALRAEHEGPGPVRVAHRHRRRTMDTTETTGAAEYGIAPAGRRLPAATR
ncbi:MAG TPA: hypothetical protein VK399_08115, partial [Longimicrobiaceae bacterium]|nr:hypothetical protein [Longimicrobiaceae bacterium]